MASIWWWNEYMMNTVSSHDKRFYCSIFRFPPKYEQFNWCALAFFPVLFSLSVRLIHIQNSWMWHVLQLRVCGNTFINVLLSLFFCTSDFERFNYAFKIVLHISDMAECLLCRPSIYQLCAYTFGGARHQMSQLFSSFLWKSSKNNVYLWRTKFGSRFKPITTVLSMLKLRNLFSRAHCSPALNKKRVQLKKHKNFETIKTN